MGSTFFFPVIFLCFWFLPHSFQPFHKSLASLPKNRALPRSSSTSNNSSSKTIAKPSQTSPGWVLTGCNFDELSLLTNSLVATRFRILFRTVKLKSFQRWSRRGHQAKQQLQARARRQKRRQRAIKGDRGETNGHKLGKQGGGDKFERAQTV